MTMLQFLDDFYVEITGDTRDSKLARYYGRFETSEDVSPDLRCELGNIKPSPSTILGDPGRYYGIDDGGEFIIKREYDGTVMIDRDWERLRVSNGISIYFLADILEYCIRKECAKRDRAMIHASGVSMEGTTLVFPAWRHAGKTNTMLSFLQRGASYLSDDRVWIGADGSVWGYPLPINMLTYNYNSFPGLSPETTVEGLKRRASDFIKNKTEGKETFFHRAIRFTNQIYIEPSNSLRHIDELIPEATYTDCAEIDALVFLRTTTEDNLSLSELNQEGAVSTLANINYKEWNKKIEEYVRAHELLVPGSEEREEMERLWRSEAAVFEDIAETVPIYKLELPQEEKWQDEELTVDLVNALDPLL